MSVSEQPEICFLRFKRSIWGVLVDVTPKNTSTGNDEKQIHEN